MEPESDSPFAVIAKYQQSAPVNVDAIARELGIKVYREVLAPDVYGMLVHDPAKGGPSGYAIYINSETAINRQRFTLAHEIAHFILHRDLLANRHVDKAMYRSDLSDKIERQANQLAADILLPLDLMKTAYQTERNPHALARLFHVASDAIEIRLRTVRTQEAAAAQAAARVKARQ